MNNDLIFYQILSTNFLRKCIEISLENFYVDIGNKRGREVRYFVIWAPIGRVLFNKLSANTLSTCQLNISQHISQL